MQFVRGAKAQQSYFNDPGTLQVKLAFLLPVDTNSSDSSFPIATAASVGAYKRVSIECLTLKHHIMLHYSKYFLANKYPALGDFSPLYHQCQYTLI